MKVRVCSIPVQTVLHIGSNVDIDDYSIGLWSTPVQVLTMSELTDKEILARFHGNNRIQIYKKISVTNVPGGGYWLNDVEVDEKQIIEMYRKYAGNETIVVGKQFFKKFIVLI